MPRIAPRNAPSQGRNLGHQMQVNSVFRGITTRSGTICFGHLFAMQFWTFWECFMWFAYANGWATMITFESNPIWFVALIVLIPIWAGFYFYTHHRVLHIGFLYRHVHSWHHRNINTGPWSGLAMHPVESFVLMTDTILFLLVPAHPIHVIFLLFHHGVGAPTSHTRV